MKVLIVILKGEIGKMNIGCLYIKLRFKKSKQNLPIFVKEVPFSSTARSSICKVYSPPEVRFTNPDIATFHEA